MSYKKIYFGIATTLLKENDAGSQGVDSTRRQPQKREWGYIDLQNL